MQERTPAAIQALDTGGGMNKEEILLAHKEHLFPAQFHYFREPLILARGRGQFLYDIDGNEYLDFFGGIVTISVGHCNPQVAAKLKAQVDTLQHVSTVFATEPIAALARRVAGITPNGKLTKSFFTNSGTEANETAILAARCYTGHSEVIALRHSYHGRSTLGMAMSGISTWKLGPATQPAISYAHNAYCYRCPFALTYPGCKVRCATDVGELIRTTTSGRVAAFLAEPIQGIGGFITPPREYFAIVAEVVRKHGGVFITDEVQSGWGRTGNRWFGIEHYEVEPEILVSAKGMANGFPIGLTAARPEVADALRGVTISTFGGNALAATAAKAVIDFIDHENLRENAAVVGAYLRERLELLKNKHPIIGEIRGMGLMQALELVTDPNSREPATAATLQLLEILRDRRLLVGKAGLAGNTLRLSPPLNISMADVDEFVARLESGLEQLESA